MSLKSGLDWIVGQTMHGFGNLVLATIVQIKNVASGTNGTVKLPLNCRHSNANKTTTL